MKALCNHFDRKVTASYDGNQGQITFGFGSCQLQANEDSLRLQVEASGAENFARIQDVIGRHLERFSGDDTLQVKWDVNPPNN